LKTGIVHSFVKIAYTGDMRIIGIDPGTGILGFGVIEVIKGKMKLVDAGVITTPAHTPHDERLEDIYDSLTDIIAETKPDYMSIEKLFFAQNVTTAMTVAQARGVAMLAGRKGKLPIAEYTPLQIKQTVTGYGKADKKQVQEMVRLQLGLSEVPKPDDCADALAAAITHSLMTRVQ
jgi:crossover junction endodeoxyribonuclease RuvC